MKSTLLALFAVAVCLPAPLEAQEDEKPRSVYPIAIFSFQERGPGVKGHGQKVADLLFAQLAASPDVLLVERDDLQKTLQELKLTLAGVVKPGEAVQVGQLTGARILVTGSVVEVEPNVYVVAKIIGTENSRVLGESVKGKGTDDLGTLVEDLAKKIAASISENGTKLVAEETKAEDRLAAIRKVLGERARPSVFVEVSERHTGLASTDPAAETELVTLLRETGFTVIDPKNGAAAQADILLRGEALSETAGRVGDLVSVKGRVEVKAIDRKTGQVIAADRQTSIAVDLAEQLAGKSALQQAAGEIAQRLLPRLAGEAPKKDAEK